MIYRNIAKNIFFAIDPETVHDRIILIGRFLGSNPITRGLTSLLFNYSNPRLEQEILGIKFKNPVGLAAGFDKDAHLTDILPKVGFGFAEVGSITGQPCEGNPKPRLWRLKKSKGLVVYYGLKNRGCESISTRLKNKKFEIPVGISIAKTNNRDTVETDLAVADYAKALSCFSEIGAYHTINISCPNAFGGEPFIDKIRLEKLLSELDKIKTDRPRFIKLSPDLSEKEIDDILEVIGVHKIHGIICSNLTKKRENEKIIDDNLPDKGGISGKALEGLADDLIRRVWRKTKSRYAIIGCGGIFSAEDAYKKIKLGASLVQLITGMIFEGPQLISDINSGLARLLERDGFKNISQAVGIENK